MPDPPAITMLWESVDPHEELTKRFGFCDAAAAADWVAEAMDRQWGFEVTGCDRLVISAGNAMAWVEADDRRLIAKWSSRPQVFGRLHASSWVAVWLDGRGLPVAAPIPASDGRLLVEFGGGPERDPRTVLPRVLLGVFPVVAGDLLDVDDVEQVADAGRLLAAFHEALVSYPERLDGFAPGPNELLVHNDFRSANILHDGSKITAVLDFEELSCQTRVADLAKAAVFLGTRYHDWTPTSEDVREAFVAAYDRVAVDPLTTAERRALPGHVAAVLAGMGWA